MKRLLCGLLCVGLIALCGCYSASSLDRKPAPRKSRPAPRKKSRPLTAKDEQVDPAFDAIFKRNPQQHENSSLSSGETSYIDKQRKDDDAALRSVRGKKRLRENTKQKDWVFGTEGGKYF